MSDITEIPSSLKERVFMHAGVLHISEEMRGDVALDSYLSLLRRQGMNTVEWHAVDSFDTFRIACGGAEAQPANDVQAQAIALLRDAFEQGASDIHISYMATYGSIRLRCMGMLREKERLLGGDAAITLIRAIYQSMTSAGSPQFILTERQEGRIVNREFLPPSVHSVRVHTEPLECATGQGTLMTLRLLYDRTQADGSLPERLEQLGYVSEDRKKLIRLARRTGLTFVAGPTGHGKSTLLKHVIESQAMDNPERSFLSIEDPPEYPIRRVSQVLVGSEAEQRGKAYQLAIAGAMRADPDVIMIGEVRYPEAATAAVDAALTGHTVWSSIHAGGAFGILWRMLSLLTTARFADPMEYLCDPGIMAGMIYQRLMPVLCPHCKISLLDVMRGDEATRRRVLNPALPVLQRLRRLNVPLDKVSLRGEGCAACQGLGATGMTVAPEIVETDMHLLRMLRQRDMAAANTYWRRELRGTSALERALHMIRDGIIDPVQTEERLGMPLDHEQLSAQQ